MASINACVAGAPNASSVAPTGGVVTAFYNAAGCGSVGPVDRYAVYPPNQCVSGSESSMSMGTCTGGTSGTIYQLSFKSADCSGASSSQSVPFTPACAPLGSSTFGVVSCASGGAAGSAAPHMSGAPAASPGMHEMLVAATVIAAAAIAALS